MTQVLKAALTSVAAFTALTLTAGAAAAVPAQTSPRAQAPSKVFTITDHLARQVAGELADQTARGHVASTTASGPADLLTIEPDTRLGQEARAANRAVLAAKALPATSGSLLRLRLANTGTRAALERGEVPLVAAAPTDDEPAEVTAYDPLGGKVLLDPVKAPDRPVLVVEVDVAKAMPMGLELVRDVLADRGIKAVKPSASRITESRTTESQALAANGYWATKINAIRLNNDQEPWIKGAAEIYSVVGGFGLDGAPAVNIVQMPYLDNDGTTYYPNQLIVHFSAYKYNLADVVMMEDDGDTNYQALATAIANALLSIADLGYYVPLVNAILSAIPTSWWTDDPDYVDSWYTLSTASSGRLNGAAANGWMDVAPYWVSAL
ncbi:DUF3103 family protein [Actinomadura alba]|uniref:DUF3103 family protein n=1 Tax=Actinomadura alba TaxID=406431 RepID=A0ABR7LP67_9ACTN|nr:DUF3103 family protein [Actinomadura alba]MBC6466272.1 DUF3103 family protein [Actinomadura alba]